MSDTDTNCVADTYASFSDCTDTRYTPRNGFPGCVDP